MSGGAAVRLARLTVPTIVCIGCGCDELHACVTDSGPCFWIAVEEDAGVGLCSACAEKPLAELVAA